MSLKIAFICDKTRFSSKIQHLGAMLLEGKNCEERPYHVGWYDPERDMFYDMNWRFREVDWEYYQRRTLFYFEPPAEMLYEDIKEEIGKHVYGILDVLLFPILQIFKINMFGDHCAEIINDQLRNKHGKVTPWNVLQAPPTPCRMLKWAQDTLEEWKRDK